MNVGTKIKVKSSSNLNRLIGEKLLKCYVRELVAVDLFGQGGYAIVGGFKRFNKDMELDISMDDNPLVVCLAVQGNGTSADATERAAALVIPEKLWATNPTECFRDVTFSLGSNIGDVMVETPAPAIAGAYVEHTRFSFWGWDGDVDPPNFTHFAEASGGNAVRNKALASLSSVAPNGNPYYNAALDAFNLGNNGMIPKIKQEKNPQAFKAELFNQQRAMEALPKLPKDWRWLGEVSGIWLVQNTRTQQTHFIDVLLTFDETVTEREAPEWVALAKAQADKFKGMVGITNAVAQLMASQERLAQMKEEQ
jgi:hypothetical protein